MESYVNFHEEKGLNNIVEMLSPLYQNVDITIL